MDRNSLVFGVVIGASLCRILGSSITDVMAILAIAALVQLAFDIVQQKKR